MPELPEVETIRRDLAGLLTGRRIAGVEVRDRRALEGFGPSGRPRRRVQPRDFQAALTGRAVKDVLRRGKYLVFDLGPGLSFLCHLRMTGQLIFGSPRPEARARILFDGGGVLNFCDARRFGELWLAGDWRQDPSIRALGPEPLFDGWDVEDWGRRLRSSRAAVHAALLDQRRLAGLGNIYALEALFRSGLRPGRRCSSVPARSIPVLAENIRRVLLEGLERRGVSFSSYRDARGEKGFAQSRLSVYGRAGEPCTLCAADLKAVKIGGRGAVYCPKCQK
ncbi:MAG: bifunctional DNA-formamidopyrimidine glycosylase/DNA-(apurinic or apyrimidinic site) lyase [Elusimicrobiota bacterium]